MQEGERAVAVGGVFFPRAGCRLASFIRVRAAGALMVTTKRIIFNPMLHHKLVAQQMYLGIDEVQGAEAMGSRISLSVTDFISIGRNLVITLRNGKKLHFRSQEADQLADAINYVVRTGGDLPPDSEEPIGGESTESSTY